ncbi:MAG: nuclear transport factor 2 family protein [Thermoleophilia bacterium]
MRPALTIVVLALLLSACGSAAPRNSAEEFSGEDKAVATAVENVEEAAREDDAKRMCTRLLSEKLLDTLERQGTNCTTAVREAFKDASSKELTVDDVTISGDTATAKVISGSGSNEKTDTLRLERSGGGWRIASLQS